MNKKTILLVGGSGYLGNHFAESLKSAGWDVTISGTKTQKKSGYICIDFSAPETYDNVSQVYDIILVLASKMTALGSIDLDHPDISINALHYGEFLQYLSHHKRPSYIVYISSMTVYYEECVSPVTEDSTLNPLHVYGLSKVLAEKVTEFFCSRHGVPGVVMRIPGVYGGSRQGGFIYNLIKKLKAGEDVHVNTQGLGYWETIHVEDLVSVISDFLQTYSWNNPFEVFNISYGQETDILETALFIERKVQIGRVICEDKKGYKPFYLSNKKVKQVIPLKIDFLKKLEEYINVI